MNKYLLQKNDITCVFDGLSQTGRIFICNMPTAHQIQLLEKLNIKSVISITKTNHPQYSQENIQKHLVIKIQDVPDSIIKLHFQQTFQFIDHHRKTGNVLVHCMAGISRSATVVIAYLMRKFNYDYQTVYSMIKRKRGKVNPNCGFVQQLKKYQQQLGIATKSRSMSKSQRRAKTPSFGFYQKRNQQCDKQYKNNEQNNKKAIKFTQISKLSKSVQKQKSKFMNIQQKLREIRPTLLKYKRKMSGLVGQNSSCLTLVTLTNNL